MCTKRSDLDSLFLAIARALHGEPPFFIWPAPLSTPAECEFYLADHYLSQLRDDISLLEKQGWEIANIAALFKHPSRLAQVLWLFGHVTSADKGFRDKLVELACTILDLLSCMRKEPLNASGKNLLWAQDEARNFLTTCDVVNSRCNAWDQQKQILARVEGTLWVYSELLYFSIHEVCKEFHGPYELESGEQILVRHYYDLKPKFWDFTEALPYETCTVVDIYEGDARICFDFFGRLSSTESLVGKLSGFAMMVGKHDCSDWECMKSVQESTAEVATRGALKLRALTRVDVMQKFMEAYNQIRIPLAEAAGREAEVPEDAMEDMIHDRKRSIVEEAYSSFHGLAQLSKSEVEAVLARVFDPRVD